MNEDKNVENLLAELVSIAENCKKVYDSGYISGAEDMFSWLSEMLTEEKKIFENLVKENIASSASEAKSAAIKESNTYTDGQTNKLSSRIQKMKTVKVKGGVVDMPYDVSFALPNCIEASVSDYKGGDRNLYVREVGKNLVPFNYAGEFPKHNFEGDDYYSYMKALDDGGIECYGRIDEKLKVVLYAGVNVFKNCGIVTMSLSGDAQDVRVKIKFWKYWDKKTPTDESKEYYLHPEINKKGGSVITDDLSKYKDYERVEISLETYMLDEYISGTAYVQFEHGRAASAYEKPKVPQMYERVEEKSNSLKYIYDIPSVEMGRLTNAIQFYVGTPQISSYTISSTSDEYSIRESILNVLKKVVRIPSWAQQSDEVEAGKTTDLTYEVPEEERGAYKGTLICRDSNGNASVMNPRRPKHIANKEYVDTSMKGKVGTINIQNGTGKVALMPDRLYLFTVQQKTFSLYVPEKLIYDEPGFEITSAENNGYFISVYLNVTEDTLDVTFYHNGTVQKTAYVDYRII